MKKIAIFGGGSGLSQILKGLKLFPLDITAVVSVSDNGRSTGRLRKGTIEIVVANLKPMESDLAKKYLTDEQKDPVILDKEVLDKMNVHVISDVLYTIEDGYYHHDLLKTAYLTFSCLMDS